MNINKIKINTWYWVPAYISKKETMPARVIEVEKENIVTLRVLETTFWVKPEDIFLSEEEAEEANRIFERKAKAVERSPFAYAVLVSLSPSISIKIQKGTVNRYEKDPNSRAMQYNWNFAPYEVNGKTIPVPFNSVFPSLKEARESAEKYRKDMAEWHRKKAEEFLEAPIVEK